MHGWDFVQDDNDPSDGYGHGTHVAGTIAAVGDNATGVVGVASTSRLMPLRVIDSNGQGTVSAGALALDYASRHARVCRRSLVVEQGLTLEDAVELGVAWLLSAGR